MAAASFALVIAPTFGSYRAAGVPAGGSSALGAWSDVVDWPVVAIHAVLAPDGKVVTWGAGPGTGQGAAHFYDVWDPAQGTGPASHALTANPAENIFCSGQHVSPTTGEIMVFGGQSDGGNNLLTSFAPGTHQLRELNTPMAYPRWYPTSTTLPDGRTLVQGGTDNGFGGTPQLTPEIFTPGAGWQTLAGATSQAIYGNTEGRPGWYYPRTWVQPDGRIFAISQRSMYYINPAGAGSIQPIAQEWTRGIGEASTAVMHRPGKVLHAGGDGGAGQASSDASIVDLTGAAPTVTPTGSMASRRSWADSTVLPDGTVLVTGGSAQANALVDVALKPELWNPATGAWTELAQGSLARLYHSASLLLPDGSVLVAGGGEPGPLFNTNAEIFYPPYLYGSDGNPAARPAWASAPGALAYGAPFGATVTSGAPIARVTLVKTGSVTHSFDMEQRFLELEFTQSGNSLAIKGPPDANVATPGHYMLFAVDANGVPSVAKIVRIAPDVPAPPPPPPAVDPAPPTAVAGAAGPLPRSRPTAAVALIARTPRRVRRGKVLTVKLQVRGRSRISARRVTVAGRFPRSLKLLSKSRKVRFRKGRLTWRAGNLRRGQKKGLVLRLRVPRKARGKIVVRSVAKGTNTGRMSRRRTVSLARAK